MEHKIIKFIGYSGSGKTTLIEKLVKILSFNGVKVATVKHDVHGIDIDKAGKDSYRYSMAGARISVVSSPEITVYKVHKELSINEIISNIYDVDLIIIEGYSSENDFPYFSVGRKETKKGFKGSVNSAIAVISDYSEIELKEIEYNGIFFDINDVDRIANFIMGNFIK